jgi:hypothetical protein
VTLKGDFGGGSPDGENWNLSKEWNKALVVSGIQMPNMMKGMKGLQTLSILKELLCPVWLYYPFILKRHNAEDLPKMMEAAGGELSGYLGQQGY